ncbi:MAG: type II toxin-antitoxin system antitoxin, RelB/DinJ family [Planctomycetota bacterium]|nr:type II toxin-antitoxin system antitoxin, RelB/DinJ family [Planctomycetota bacterium]
MCYAYSQKEDIPGAETINVTIRLDREIKENAEKLFDDFGRDLSAAVNIYIRQALRQGKMPFEICDRFFGEKNQARLRRSIAHAETGQVTVHDLLED